MRYAIDRFEEDRAILIPSEGGEAVEVARALLPEGARESDILSFEEGVYTILSEETARKKAEVSERLKNLYNRNKNK